MTNQIVQKKEKWIAAATFVHLLGWRDTVGERGTPSGMEGCHRGERGAVGEGGALSWKEGHKDIVIRRGKKDTVASGKEGHCQGRKDGGATSGKI